MLVTAVLLDHFHPILGSAVDTWATVFVAIGTVGAVAYALFRDLVVVPRRRPKLDLRLAAPEAIRSSSGQQKDSTPRISGYGWRTEPERTPPMTSS
jgi:hypothetical protein